MKPIEFMSYSLRNRMKKLYQDGVFIRRRSDELFHFNLFLYDNHYYEVWILKTPGVFIRMRYLSDEEADVLYPGPVEKRRVL